MMELFRGGSGVLCISPTSNYVYKSLYSYENYCGSKKVRHVSHLLKSEKADQPDIDNLELYDEVNKNYLYQIQDLLISIQRFVTIQIKLPRYGWYDDRRIDSNLNKSRLTCTIRTGRDLFLLVTES